MDTTKETDGLKTFLCCWAHSCICDISYNTGWKKLILPYTNLVFIFFFNMKLSLKEMKDFTKQGEQ